MRRHRHALKRKTRLWWSRGTRAGNSPWSIFVFGAGAASSSNAGRRVKRVWSLGVALRASIVASSCVAYGVVGTFVVCGTATIGASATSGGMALLVGPVRGGASVIDVQKLLGHANVSTTQVYTQLADAHLREVYADAHPRAR